MCIRIRIAIVSGAWYRYVLDINNVMYLVLGPDSTYAICIRIGWDNPMWSETLDRITNMHWKTNLLNSNNTPSFIDDVMKVADDIVEMGIFYSL